MQSIVAHLQTTPAGATQAELQEALHLGRALVAKLVVKLVASNAIVYAIVGGVGKDTRTRRYFAPEHHKLDDKTMPVVARRTKQRTAPVRLVGEERITSETKVTICPTFEDKRYAFDPPPGWRGAITQDWEKERGL